MVLCRMSSAIVRQRDLLTRPNDPVHVVRDVLAPFFQAIQSILLRSGRRTAADSEVGRVCLKERNGQVVGHVVGLEQLDVVK